MAVCLNNRPKHGPFCAAICAGVCASQTYLFLVCAGVCASPKSEICPGGYAPACFFL